MQVKSLGRRQRDFAVFVALRIPGSQRDRFPNLCSRCLTLGSIPAVGRG
jgi:hypothetical protein